MASEEKKTVTLKRLEPGARYWAKSSALRPGGKREFSVGVAEAKEVALRVLNGGDGFTCDHAAWGFARFLEINMEDPLAGR